VAIAPAPEARSAVVVRPARADEYAVAGEATVAGYATTGLLGLDDGYADELRDAAGRAAAEHTELLVAVDSDTGQVVGSVTFVLPGSPLAELPGPGEAEFRMLAVDPDAQGRGAGELLVRACVDRARGHGCHRMVISVAPISRAAHRLYSRLGFRRAPERDWLPVPDFPLLVYELPL
jgi:ribosomal protein S18 acetylase RimI-like enzyme